MIHLTSERPQHPARGILPLTRDAARRPPKRPPTPPTAAKIDLNTATAEQLDDLPGIGEATAKKIIENRPYKSVDDLSKAGLSESKIAKIAPLVTIGGKSGASTSAKPAVKAAEAKPAADKAAAKININTATPEELDDLPGIGEATAKKIIDNRPYKSVEELSKAGLSESKIAKLEPLVTVGGRTGTAARGAAAGSANANVNAGPSSSKINLNTATEKELEELPGVGQATAARIIAGRPYKSVEDLSKAGLSEKQIAKFESQVTVGKSTSSGTASGAKTASDKTPAAPTDDAPARTPPSKGMVWVNTDSGVYHKEGDRWYGRTKEGKWMTQAEADKAGYRESKND
jgi:competence protein ComEA